VARDGRASRGPEARLVAPRLDRADGLPEGPTEDLLSEEPEHDREKRPLKFLPSRTTTASMSVVPSGFGVSV
jgi:hypothetical protein